MAQFIPRSKRMTEARNKGRHSNKEWNDMLEEFNYICVRCLNTSREIHKDHIIPIFMGGSDGIENIQPLCHVCNLSKRGEVVNWAKIRRAEMREEIENAVH